MDRRDFIVTSLFAGSAGLVGVSTSFAADFEDTDQPTVLPPKFAKVLFDGSNLSGWVSGTGGIPGWKLKDGYAEVVPGTGNIHTRETFSDFQLHVEFWLPLMPDATGQGRANSGVYLQGLYEVQVLDSFGLDSRNNDCGAIYEVAPPLRNACKRPERWQTYDIAFKAPRFDASGQLQEKGKVTVLQNGILIHHAQEVATPTRAAMRRDPTTPGPIMLQDHGNAVRYRNVWLIPAG